jgi:hypothetical protein
MNQNEENDVPFYNTYRSLGTKVYRIKFFVVRLTDADIGITLIPMVLVWGFLDRTGIAQKQMMFGFKYDPWAWMIATIGTALLISLGNKLRPNDSITIVIRGWLSKKLYGARSKAGDRGWKATNAKLTGKDK